MRNVTLTLTLCLIAATASATNRDNRQDQHQGQEQDQHQGQEQSAEQSQSQSANNEGVSTTVNHNINNPDDIKIRNTPDAYAPPSFPTAPCRIGGSIGGSAPGVGLSLGGSKMDWECNARATADSFARLGVPAVGLILLCKTDAITHNKHGASMTPEECEALVAQTQQATLEAATRDDVHRATEIITDHVSVEHDGTRRAVETCTDCYGEK